jgi:hypothetical protein
VSFPSYIHQYPLITCTFQQDTEPRSLPLDVFGIIAEWLVAQDELATCAALNATSKYVQDETRPTLWRRVVYHFKNGPRSEESRDKKAGIKWRATFGSVAAEYIQYVLVSFLSSLPVRG